MKTTLIFSLGVLSSVCLRGLVAAETADQSRKKADELHAQGYFEGARSAYEAALRLAPDDYRIIERLGFIHFFQGEYARAIECFHKVIGREPSKKRLMLAYTAFAYYHMRRYADLVATLEDVGKLNLLDAQQMRLLEKQPPYRIESKSSTTALPFLQTDPLPVLRIQVESKGLCVLVDTGASQLVVDSDFANENGIHAVSKQEVKGFAGGKASEVSFGLVHSVSLGDVTIRNVPVWILPTRRFSPGFVERIDGILGTEILMQFCPTLDFLGKKLTLRMKSKQYPAQSTAKPPKAKVPFVIDGLHYMYAQCWINDKGPVLMYFDSGLADDHGASLELNSAALADLQIAKPSLTEEGDGGGGTHKYGYVEIDSIRVSELVRHKQKAAYSGGSGAALTPSGYKTYGLVSHNFLKHYSWTIDFDNRVFLFDQ